MGAEYMGFVYKDFYLISCNLISSFMALDF